MKEFPEKRWRKDGLENFFKKLTKLVIEKEKLGRRKNILINKESILENCCTEAEWMSHLVIKYYLQSKPIVTSELIINFVISNKKCLLSNHISSLYCICLVTYFLIS